MTALTVPLRPYRPADRPWIVRAHRAHYAASDGFDDSFGETVERVLHAFEAGDPSRQRSWIAEGAEGPLGCVFLVEGEGGLARLRLFYAVPRARGTGLERRMLACLIAAARDLGYAGVMLGTHESHRAAGRLYARAGFTLEFSRPVRSFGVQMVEQSWRLTF